MEWNFHQNRSYLKPYGFDKTCGLQLQLEYMSEGKKLQPRSTHQQQYVEYKPVDIPITVRIDTPSKAVQELMKWPKNKKVLAVRVPNTFSEYETHYLTNSKTAASHGQEARKATIEALRIQHHKSAREILRALAGGEVLLLHYSTSLPYLTTPRGPLREPVFLNPKQAKLKKKRNAKSVS